MTNHSHNNCKSGPFRVRNTLIFTLQYSDMLGMQSVICKYIAINNLEHTIKGQSHAQYGLNMQLLMFSGLVENLTMDHNTGFPETPVLELTRITVINAHFTKIVITNHMAEKMLT
jgi:hypothetical protein